MSWRRSGRARPRAAGAAMAAMLATLVPAACGSDDGGGPTLYVYSGRHYGIENAFSLFTQETGIQLEFLTGDDAQLRERIAAEGDETEADVYITVDAGNLANGAEQGIFREIDSPILDGAIPEQYRDPGHRWWGLAVRARAIVYNPANVAPDEVPTTYEELADPVWEGRECQRNSSNVYQQSLVASLIDADGEERARDVVAGWAANSDLMNNDVLVLESIADGICDVGIVNHYYLARMIEEDPDFPVELVWPNQDDRGVHINVSGGGVTRYSDQPELAQQFLEWLATDGQDVLVAANHEYPANPAVEPEPLITAEFGLDFKRDVLSAATIGELNAEAIRVMDEAGYR